MRWPNVQPELTWPRVSTQRQHRVPPFLQLFNSRLQTTAVGLPALFETYIYLLRSSSRLSYTAAPRLVAPVAYLVILEHGIGQFREFESPRVHTRMNFWRLFRVQKLTGGKRESVD